MFNSCGEDITNPQEPNINEAFDRSVMLTFWADNIIVPTLEAHDLQLASMVTSKNDFLNNPTANTLQSLRASWLSAYKSWQAASMFDIGPAEALGYRNFVNIFPTNITEINENITAGNYNLALPSNFDAQGFPALDYLLFGLGDSDEAIISTLTDTNYTQYLDDLVTRLQDLNTQVLGEWNGSYRADFISKDGSSATASTDKMVNDFLFYYERFFRAGKIGIPAGVFSGNEITMAVEAPYSGVYSKELFMDAFDAIKAFFNGHKFGDTSIIGVSLKQYIDQMTLDTDNMDLSDRILNQWTSASTQAQGLKNDLSSQVEMDNVQMLTTYDELQKAVPLLKVDMMQVLDIKVDFVDADGD